MRQPQLKPQDVMTAVWLASSNEHSVFSYAKLGNALALSGSEAHASVQRCIMSSLISKEFGALQPNYSAVLEFLIHGMRYVYPPIFGPMARGMRTGAFAQPLASHFHDNGDAAVVWPALEGLDRGMSLCPLYPAIPKAAKQDPRFYETAALVDAIRAGSARERELALSELRGYFR